MIYSMLPLKGINVYLGVAHPCVTCNHSSGKQPLQQTCNFVQLRLAKCTFIFRKFELVSKFCALLVEQERQRTIIYVISKMCLHVTLTEECSSDRC